MDFAYFNAVLRSTVFPPVDPWFAGGYLNYYYFGFVLVGTPIKLLGITPSVAYNLLVPAVFALTGISAFAIGFNIMAARWFFPRDDGSEDRAAPLGDRLKAALRLPAGSPYVAGIMALLLTTVLGNLFTPSVAAEGVMRLGGCDSAYDMGRWYQDEYLRTNGRLPDPEEMAALEMQADSPSLGDRIGFTFASMQRTLGCATNGIGATLSGATWPMGTNRWFWAARSIVGELPGNSNEINEFPMFTFTYGDLHAHMIALPVTLLVMGWLLSEVLIAGRGERSILMIVGATALGGLAIGILRPTNTWDWLTYLVLGILGLLYTMLLRRHGVNRRRVVGWGAQIVVLYLAQHLGSMPFMTFFATSYSQVISFQGNKTPIWAYLIMHGIFLFFIVSFLVWQTRRVMRAVFVRDFIGRAWAALLLIAALGVGVLLTLFFGLLPGQVWLLELPVPLAWLAVPLLIWCVVLFFVPHQTREVQTMLAMIGLALGLTMAVELVVLFGDIGRQNTFFKFYMQIWFLLGIPAAVMLTWLVQASRAWAVRLPWLMFGALLLAIGALYPVVATQAKNIERMAATPPTLDGLAYMQQATHYEVQVETRSFPLKDDLAIIHWLQDNVRGTPVILEARQASTEYKWNARISINTGLPTVIGWNFHQMQQRTLDPLPTLVQQRGNNASFMYNSPDITRVWRMITFYRVQYIIVGHLERIIYSRAGLEKFEEMVRLGLLKEVYQNGEDRIYAVVEGVEPAPSLVGMRP
jgi:YYY domain-containing protein